jgi:hypothetical protein
MAKYDKKSQKKVKRAMHEMKSGKLKSGSGKTVKSRKQAIAIGLSEARKEGSKAPKKAKSTKAKGQRSAVSKRKTSRKRSTAKRH